MNRSFDANFWLLLGGTALLAVGVAIKDSALLGTALHKSGQLFGAVWPEILLGFLVAGLIDVLVPQPVIVRWLGEQHLVSGILAGWALGMLLPGGPYLLFPLAATLMRQGAAPGPLIALLTAKVLLSPIRLVSYEAPLLGWPMTLARFLPSMLLPPVVAIVGQWFYTVFRK